MKEKIKTSKTDVKEEGNELGETEFFFILEE